MPVSFRFSKFFHLNFKSFDKYNFFKITFLQVDKREGPYEFFRAKFISLFKNNSGKIFKSVLSQNKFMLGEKLFSYFLKTLPRYTDTDS